MFYQLLDPPTVQRRDNETDQFLRLIQNPFNTNLSKQAFLSSLTYSLGAAFIFVLVFCWLRPRNKTVYAPRLKQLDIEHAPSPLGNGFWSWVSPSVRTREEELVEKIGLDATLFLRFAKMLRNLMVVLSLIGCGVYIPTNVLQNRRNKVIYNSNFFINLTPLGVWGSACWVHVVVSYVFDVLICLFIWWNYRAAARMRREYLASPQYQGSLHARTLLLTHLPDPDQAEYGIDRVLSRFEQGQSHSATIARNVKGLPELIEEHDEAVRKLEKILTKYVKSSIRVAAQRPPCYKQSGDISPGMFRRVRAIDDLTGRIQKLREDIKKKRIDVANQEPLCFGFASFENVREAHLIALAVQHDRPPGVTIRLAPTPNDLIWENLILDRRRRQWVGFVNNFWVAVLTVIWTVPNGLIAIFLANLSNLGTLWPSFSSQLERHPKAWGAIQGILAPLVTTLFYTALPSIFRQLSVYAGDYSRTSRERHVTAKLYAFSVFNNLVVFSLFSTAWKYGTAVASAKESGASIWSALVESDPFGNIMIAFCDVSPFWLNYLLQRNFGAAFDLSQVLRLAKLWSFKSYPTRKLLSPTPRELEEVSAPPPFDYASNSNNCLFYITVALVFAPFQPLVLPVTSLYFSFELISKSYLLLYIFVTKYESGGALWRILVDRLLFATLLSNLVVTIFIGVRGGSYHQIVSMLPLLAVLGGFKFYCYYAFDGYSKFCLEDPQDPEGSSQESIAVDSTNDRVVVRFDHPALYKELMIPLVDPRAKYLVRNISDGQWAVPSRKKDECGEDFPMRNMRTDREGRGDGTGPDKAVEDGVDPVLTNPRWSFRYPQRSEDRCRHPDRPSHKVYLT
ncbi:DUF221-domain-containing protein [Poronia punctata]|nr:DUF221-domain-containing protein [Poronia punctata]